jgi:hypothetical protein
MTGEITLRGRVLPIGGLKEKLLAALRGGIKKVLIPKENAKDLAEIPDNVKRRPRQGRKGRWRRGDDALTQTTLHMPQRGSGFRGPFAFDNCRHRDLRLSSLPMVLLRQSWEADQKGTR